MVLKFHFFQEIWKILTNQNFQRFPDVSDGVRLEILANHHCLIRTSAVFRELNLKTLKIPHKHQLFNLLLFSIENNELLGS